MCYNDEFDRSTSKDININTGNQKIESAGAPPLRTRDVANPKKPALTARYRDERGLSALKCVHIEEKPRTEERSDSAPLG